MDLFFVCETQAQRTRFLFSHVTQNSNTGRSFTLPHTSQQITHTPQRSSTLTQTSHRATPSLKPTPVLTLTQTLRAHHSESQTHTIITTDHSHSNPHQSSQSLTLQTQIHPNLKHQSSVSHSSNLAPTDLVTLQTLTLTQTSRRAIAQPHHSSNLAPLLNLNLKVGTPSQSACFD